MRFKHKGITLVEVLIVTIVLGILAFVVVPQFSQANTDTKLNTLRTNLQVIRGQLELYRVQHNDAYPEAGKFVPQMTLKSKPDGTTTETSQPGFELGPYLQAIPINPYTNGNTVGSGEIGLSDWFYNASTGVFRANHQKEFARF